MNNQVKHFALSLAVVLGGAILGCSSDGSDESAAISHGSVSSIEQGSAPSVGGSGSTAYASGGKTSSSTTTSPAGAAGIPNTNDVGGSSAAGGNTSAGGASSESGGSSQTGGNTSTTSTGGSTASTGGKTGSGGSSPTGGNTATGGSTLSVGTGGSSQTGGNTSTTSTGGQTQIACVPAGQLCATSAACCSGLTCQNAACTSGTPSTGGTSSTGGSSGTSTGGTPSTGGTSSTGGSATGGSTVVATGGSSSCTPAARPVNTVTTTTQLNCGQPIKENLFGLTAMNTAGRIAALAENDILVIEHTYDVKSYLTRWNGSVWSQEFVTPSTQYGAWGFNAIARLNANSTMIGGHAECTGCMSVPKVFLGYKTSWSEVSAGFPSWGTVVDVAFIEGKSYALVNYNNTAQLYTLVGTTSSSWSLVQSWDWSIGKRIWATSLKDIFVAGSKVNESNADIGMLISHFDGCSWNDISTPSDVQTLTGFHGAEGTVIAIGFAGSTPVRLISSDLVNWTRSNGDGSTATETAVWMSSPGLVLVGGSATTDGRYGYGKLVAGVSSWTASYLDSAYTLGVDDIVRIPSTNTYFITSRQDDPVDLTLRPRAYRVTCQ